MIGDLVKHIILRETACQPEFIIMYPALGCPGIATPEGGKMVLHVLLLVRNNSPIIKDCTSLKSKQAIARRLSYSKWTLPPTNTPGTGTISPEDIEDIHWNRDHKPDSDTLHKVEFSIPQRALDYLVNFGFDSYSNLLHLHLHLDFQVSGSRNILYNLINCGSESEIKESEVIRKAVRLIDNPLGESFNLKDGGTTTLGYIPQKRMKKKKTPQKKDVELYHPFLVTNKECLNVAQVTDPHISTHWELYERRIKSSYGGGPLCAERDPRNPNRCVHWLAERFNNYNERFWKTLQQINSDSKVDIIVLTGDLIDYNRGHIIEVSGEDGNKTYDDGGDIKPDNYKFNRNWVFFYELLLKDYKKPIFTILGNHEYLLNPYPLTQIIPVHLWNIIPLTAQTESFGGDTNITYSAEDSEAHKIGEVFDSSPLVYSDANAVRGARRNHNEPELDRLLRQHANNLLGPASNPEAFWFSTPFAVAWYHLVINPFADFTFAHQDQSFLMLDWKGVDAKPNSEISQVGSLLLLPKPTDCLSGSQEDMVQRWLKGEHRLKVLCLHAPLLNPWTDIGNYYLRQGKLRRDIYDQDRAEAGGELPKATYESQELDLGTMEKKSRIDLIKKLRERAEKSVFARARSTPEAIADRVVVLSGHGHANRMFQFRGSQIELMDEDIPNTWLLDAPFIIMTNSCGPIGRENEASEWQELQFPGYRVIEFENDKKVSGSPYRVKPVEQRRFTIKDPSWLRNDVKNEINLASGSYSYDLTTHRGIIERERVRVFPTAMGAPTDINDFCGLIEEVNGTYTVDNVHGGDILVMKKITPGGSLIIEDNGGTIVVLENWGKIIIKNNGEYIRVDNNREELIVNKNNDTILVEQNSINGKIDILSNGAWRGGTQLIRITANSGEVKIRSNDDTIEIGENQNLIHIVKNDEDIRLHKNIGGRVKVDDNDDEIEVPKGTPVIQIKGKPVIFK